jgi:hypothetical protein
MSTELKMRTILSYTLVLCLGVFALDAFWVLVFGGINVELSGVRIRSTTIESPILLLLGTFVLLLLTQGKANEAVLFCSSLVFAGMIGEAALRIVDHPRSGPQVNHGVWAQPSELFGAELAPGYNGPGPLGVPIAISSQGFRDAEHKVEKQRDSIRILGLGDSFTFGWGVSVEETFLKRLESLLHQATGKDIETINRGVPGWGLTQHYLYLKTAGTQYTPDVTILAYFVDDLLDLQESLPPSLQKQDRPKFQGQPLHHSRLFNFLRSLARDVREKNRNKRITHLYDLDARRAELSKKTRFLVSNTQPEEIAQSVKTVDDILSRIKHICVSNGSELVLLYIPDVAQLHHHENQYINQVLAGLTHKLGILFVDMTPIFEQASALNTYYLWPKDLHTNAQGHFEIAKALTDLICRFTKCYGYQAVRELPVPVVASGS